MINAATKLPVQTKPLMGLKRKRLDIRDWGIVPYESAWRRQKDLVAKRLAGQVPDQLILVEHPSVITLGKRTAPDDLLANKNILRARGIELFHTDRGGKATYHGPGQLVAYPIILLEERDLHRYVKNLLRSVENILRRYGLDPQLKKGEPGVWVAGQKIASLGVAVKKWVTYHGVALNVNTDIDHFSFIVPCGKPLEIITSMKRELGKEVEMKTLKKQYIESFAGRLGYPDAQFGSMALGEAETWKQ